MKLGAQRVVFQDFNQDVLDFHTRINIQINDPAFIERAEFLQCDWNVFNGPSAPKLKGEGSIDIIFGADILYETKNYASLLKLFDFYLTPKGSIYIFTRYIYFGNSGSLFDFQNFVKTSDVFECHELFSGEGGGQGSENNMNIIVLTRLPKQSSC